MAYCGGGGFKTSGVFYSANALLSLVLWVLICSAGLRCPEDCRVLQFFIPWFTLFLYILRVCGIPFFCKFCVTVMFLGLWYSVAGGAMWAVAFPNMGRQHTLCYDPLVCSVVHRPAVHSLPWWAALNSFVAESSSFLIYLFLSLTISLSSFPFFFLFLSHLHILLLLRFLLLCFSFPAFSQFSLFIFSFLRLLFFSF